MRARCRVSGEDYDIVTTPITESINAELLDTLCELRLNIASADVTGGMLIAEIEPIAGRVKLRLNMTESDVYARVLDYFNELSKAMRANGLAECFSGNDGVREKWKRLVASLHRATLKSERSLYAQARCLGPDIAVRPDRGQSH
ncbi:hypothetical protein PC129_g9479 [Phytophthora cactorum]|uniref:Uncharacterized protein n=1 Tax=Phytophthora cactorum TaxID=29920 RepID=A0A329S9H0_9STRA|nr:hypothetical protein Pcac1_g26770 [Phytophthora cactorum]KAG2821639.1 hypothetical protein PC112_g11267 [Phytophthora cactorum]KAG2824167.1 hypothetical protein PC111_g9927 [Phytophthora cactorum]KAG2856189.1 hypothetical protein PC113_g11785 [Phytophthora cactorum]KAG2903371.1 hypothetical protein PC114_g12313 [Phytophthora cactorum]